MRRAPRTGSARSSPARSAFLLHDTYGFPVEVTREIVGERGLTLDLDGFEAAMDDAARARPLALRRAATRCRTPSSASRARRDHATEFKGYERDEISTPWSRTCSRSTTAACCSRCARAPSTPRWAARRPTSGWIEGDARPGRGRGRAAAGRGPGARRPAARRGRSRRARGSRRPSPRSTGTTWPPTTPATHLLHYALRSRLGKDVTQAGSSVRADKFRFDFAYHEPMGRDRLSEIEEIVNRQIVENHPVRTFTTSIEHAQDLGAMALFGEKYGDFVRVVEIDDFSRELCGGHARRRDQRDRRVQDRLRGQRRRQRAPHRGRHGPSCDRVLPRARPPGRPSAAGVLGARDDQLLAGDREAAGRSQGTRERDRRASLRARPSRWSTRSWRGAERMGDVNVDRDHHHGPRHGSPAQPGRPGPRPYSLRPSSSWAAESDGKSLLVVSASREVRGVHAGDLVKSVAPVLGGGGGGNASLGRGGGGEPSKLPAAARRAPRARSGTHSGADECAYWASTTARCAPASPSLTPSASRAVRSRSWWSVTSRP